jgi:hypothetical protein
MVINLFTIKPNQIKTKPNQTINLRVNLREKTHKHKMKTVPKSATIKDPVIRANRRRLEEWTEQGVIDMNSIDFQAMYVQDFYDSILALLQNEVPDNRQDLYGELADFFLSQIDFYNFETPITKSFDIILSDQILDIVGTMRLQIQIESI